MEPLSKKESTWATIVGIAIGTICGMIMSIAILKEHKQCTQLERENSMMREIIMTQQDQLR